MIIRHGARTNRSNLGRAKSMIFYPVTCTGNMSSEGRKTLDMRANNTITADGKKAGGNTITADGKKAGGNTITADGVTWRRVWSRSQKRHYWSCGTTSQWDPPVPNAERTAMPAPVSATPKVSYGATDRRGPVPRANILRLTQKAEGASAFAPFGRPASVAIIIPFRDTADGERMHQLRSWNESVAPRLDALQASGKLREWKLFVVVQSDGEPFNRGLLLNVGYVLASSSDASFDTYIFHDVDLVPDDELLAEYATTLPRDCFHHLGARFARYAGAGDAYVGGVLACPGPAFERVNGFPNHFWGWGGEDDALRDRVRACSIRVTRPERGSMEDLEHLGLREKMAALKKTGEKNMRKWEDMEQDRRTWRDDGLNTCLTGWADPCVKQLLPAMYRVDVRHPDTVAAGGAGKASANA